MSSRMKVFHALFVWSSLYLLPCFAPAARAQAEGHATNDARAREHFTRGQSYFGDARYDEAAAEFATAYELSKRPEMLINEARALELAQRVDEAIEVLTTLLDQYSSSSYRAEATEQLERLYEKRPARAASVAPPSSPPAIAQEPEPRELPAQKTPAEEREDRAVPSSRWWPSSPLTLVLGSLALTAGVTSLGTGLYAHHLHGELDRRCENHVCSPSDEDDVDRGRRFARTSTTLSFVGLTLAATTAVLWTLEIKRARSHAEVRLSLAPGRSEAQLRWEL